MKRLVIIFGLFAVSISIRAQSYDICVYGATSAGVIAAYTAAKLHKSVILVEPGKHLGGLTTGGLGYTDIGNKFAITGLARNFYRRIGKHYGAFEQWIFEPHVAEQVFKDFVVEGNVKVLYQYRIVSAMKEKGFIQSIGLENSANPSATTNKTIKAKMFIDCSYEGDLMARAGVSYVVGREANSKYNETYNGVQLKDGHQFPDGIDPYRIPGKPASGLLWGIGTDTLLPAGSGDKRVQAYNFRICLTNDPINRVPINRPEGYDSTTYELLLRLMQAQPNKQTLNDYCIVSMMPHNKTDINNRGGFSTDMIGMNYHYPEADYREREEIVKRHEQYTKGLLWFLGHDPRVPSPLRAEMQQWGYPKDEYIDNGNWSPQLYIRECRRMIGDYVMTQGNCEGRAVVSDGIGLAAYTMDSHNCERLVVNGMVKNEGNVEQGGFGPYPISYRSLIPRASECRNLYVPVCLSASHIAYGSIRMEPVFMVLGQSSAAAAAIAIDAHQSVQDVDIKKLQALLKQNPLMDGSTPEVLTDNDDSANISVEGSWQQESHGGYGPSWLKAAPQVGVQQVLFSPAIDVAGRYAIYSYVPLVEGAARQTRYIINDGSTSREVIVSSHVRVEGQTSGEWVFLGNFLLPKGNKSSVSISTRGADGYVVADALLFVPVKK